ncbi:hypothetical protein HDV00_010659 [Rhizophlyctis rosea]|nr:hypothetical protein HDV00_010659 [Rhizophlyctis rosea]
MGPEEDENVEEVEGVKVIFGTVRASSMGASWRPQERLLRAGVKTINIAIIQLFKVLLPSASLVAAPATADMDDIEMEDDTAMAAAIAGKPTPGPK